MIKNNKDSEGGRERRGKETFIVTPKSHVAYGSNYILLSIHRQYVWYRRNGWYSNSNPRNCIYLFNLRILIGFHSFRLCWHTGSAFFRAHRGGFFQSSNSEIEKIVDFFWVKRGKKIVQKLNLWSIFFFIHAVTLTKLMYHKLKYGKKNVGKNGDKKRFTAVAVAFVGICTRGSI